MKRSLFTTLITGICSLIGWAQHLDKAKLDQYFNLLESNNQFMGSVAVAQNGTILYAKTIGFADVENKIKADKHTKYRIGSISKTFTAVLVFKAVEEKKLTLRQTIRSFFPELKDGDKITIKHLLSHQSGLKNFTQNEDYLSWNTQPKTEQEMRALIAGAGSDFEPGSQVAYSNSNFVLLTYILEKVFQKPYSELLTTFITQPLGLKNTYLGGTIHPENNECKSYNFIENWSLASETDISIPLGAGGIVATPADLVRFSEALFGGKLLQKESLELMTTDNIGLFKMPFYDKSGYGHTGGIDGFSSVFAYFPDDKVAYALTSNGSNYNNNDISIAVLSALYNRAYALPSDSKKYTPASEDLDHYLGVYASTRMPLKMTITKEGATLIAQGTGQPAFPLEATEKNTFKFTQAGIVLKFNPEKKIMILQQGGAQFTFTKEESEGK